MKQKQFEFQHQLELAKLDAEKDVEEARERTEMAELECKLAEREFSCLLSEENRPERLSVEKDIDIDGNFTSATDAGPQLVLPPAVSTQLASTPQDHANPVLFPILSTSFHAFPPMCSASSTQVSTCNVTSSRVSVLPITFSLGSTLPASSSQVPEFLTTSMRASAVPVASSRVSTLPTCSSRVPEFSTTSMRASAVPVACSRVSTLPTYSSCVPDLSRVLLWFLLCPSPHRCRPRVFPSFHALPRVFLPCTRVSPCFLPSPTTLVRHLHMQHKPMVQSACLITQLRYAVLVLTFDLLTLKAHTFHLLISQ